MKLIRYTLILFVLIAASAQAQSAAMAFRSLGLGVNLPDLFYLHNNKDVPLPILEDTRSPFFPLAASREMEFYRIEKLQDGTLLRIPVAKAALPLGARVLLFVFSSGPSKNIVVEAMDESLAAFPGGSYRFLNRTEQRLEARVREQKMVIPEGGTSLLSSGGTGTTAFVQLLESGPQRPRILLSNNWAFSAETRTLVVVTPPIPPSSIPIVRRIGEPIAFLQAPASGPSRPNSP